MCGISIFQTVNSIMPFAQSNFYMSELGSTCENVWDDSCGEFKMLFRSCNTPRPEIAF